MFFFRSLKFFRRLIDWLNASFVRIPLGICCASKTPISWSYKKSPQSKSPQKCNIWTKNVTQASYNVLSSSYTNTSNIITEWDINDKEKVTSDATFWISKRVHSRKTASELCSASPACTAQMELYNWATSSSFCFTVWFRLRRGNGTRMQHKPHRLGSFVWLRVVDRPGICARADATVRMFTQGKLSEKYAVRAGQRQQVRQSTLHSLSHDLGTAFSSVSVINPRQQRPLYISWNLSVSLLLSRPSSLSGFSRCNLTSGF